MGGATAQNLNAPHLSYTAPPTRTGEALSSADAARTDTAVQRTVVPQATEAGGEAVPTRPPRGGRNFSRLHTTKPI